jgi:hypothetical protein
MEQRELSGILFKNNKKEKDNHPDYQGSCMIEGTEYWMSSWLKKGKEGTFMSFAFKAKDKQEARKPDRQPSREPDDNIPF